MNGKSIGVGVDCDYGVEPILEVECALLDQLCWMRVGYADEVTYYDSGCSSDS